MMMIRTKSAAVVDVLLLKQLSSRRSFFSGLDSLSHTNSKCSCSSNVVSDHPETRYPKKEVIDPFFQKFYQRILGLEMLEKMTREDPLPCVYDFTHILEVVNPLLVNHNNVYYKKSYVSFINSFLVGLVFEDRGHEACMFLNKLIKHKLCQPTTLMYNTVFIAVCDNPHKTMMDDALKLYQEMVSQPDVVTYNSLVSGLCKIRRWPKAYFLLKELLDKGISPDVETFNILINTICCQGRLQVASHVIYMMHERGVSPNIATYNLLIDAHCVNGEMDKARSLVSYMVSNHHLPPDTATYTSLLNGYCNDYDKMDEANDYCKDDNKMDDAMLIYHEMNEKGFKPNCLTYNRMIQSCFSAERFEDALKLVRDVLAQGQTLDTFTYCDILHDLLEKELLAEALSLYDLLGEDSKLNSDMSVIQVLLDGLINGCRELDFARELFEGLSARGIKPTPSIYNSMIGGFCEEGLINDAKRLFLEMEENHCWPTTYTYNYLLGVYLKNKCYDDVKVLLYKMKGQKHRLYKWTLSMLRASVAAGSLDVTLSNLIKKLV